MTAQQPGQLSGLHFKHRHVIYLRLFCTFTTEIKKMGMDANTVYSYNLHLRSINISNSSFKIFYWNWRKKNVLLPDILPQYNMSRNDSSMELVCFSVMLKWQNTHLQLRNRQMKAGGPPLSLPVLHFLCHLSKLSNSNLLCWKGETSLLEWLSFTVFSQFLGYMPHLHCLERISNFIHYERALKLHCKLTVCLKGKKFAQNNLILLKHKCIYWCHSKGIY